MIATSKYYTYYHELEAAKAQITFLQSQFEENESSNYQFDESESAKALETVGLRLLRTSEELKGNYNHCLAPYVG